MNAALWVLQGVLACAFPGVGIMKIVHPKEKLGHKWPKGQVRYARLRGLRSGDDGT